MAVSGSKNFELDVTEYIEEAFERCVERFVPGTTSRPLNAL